MEVLGFCWWAFSHNMPLCGLLASHVHLKCLLWLIIMNSMELVIRLHSISWKKTPNDAVTPQCQSQFTPKMKANAVPHLLSSLVWIDQYTECNGQVSWNLVDVSANFQLQSAWLAAVLPYRDGPIGPPDSFDYTSSQSRCFPFNLHSPWCLGWFQKAILRLNHHVFYKCWQDVKLPINQNYWEKLLDKFLWYKII